MGTGAGAPPFEFHVTFVPAAGEAAGPPIDHAIFVSGGILLYRPNLSFLRKKHLPHLF